MSRTVQSLHLRHSSFSNPSVALSTSHLILQPFHCSTYVTVHSPTLPSLYLRQSSFSNPSVALPTTQLILQPFFRFSYVTGSSLTSPGEPLMIKISFYIYLGNQNNIQPTNHMFKMTICFLCLLCFWVALIINKIMEHSVHQGRPN